MTFDWTNVQTVYGSAADLPAEVFRAEEMSDPMESLDVIFSQIAFISDNGTLNRGAAPFATLMFDAIRNRMRRGLSTWPFLRGILVIVSARAKLGDSFGLAPGEGVWLYQAPQSLEQDLVFENTQRRFDAEVDAEVRSNVELLARLIRDGSSEDRAAAAVLAIVARASKAPILDALEAGISREGNPRTRASLQLAWARSGDGSSATGRSLIEDLSDDGVRGEGASIACMWRPELFSAHRELVLRRIATAIVHMDGRSSHDLYDYGWHHELICGEAARAVWASSLPRDQKVALFTDALQVDVHDDPNSLRAPEISPAVPSSWFLMRLGLARHYHRGSILGPEDLDDSERDVLHRLDQYRNWMPWGGYFPERFGIVEFVSVIGRLLRRDDDALSPLLEGTWGLRSVRWSKWKWLRSAIDQTLRGSVGRDAGIERATEVVSEVAFDDLVEIALATAGEQGLPYEPLVIRVLEMSTSLAPAARAQRCALIGRSAAIGDPGRRTAVELALAAAFGPSEKYGEIRSRANAIASERLRIAIQRAVGT